MNASPHSLEAEEDLLSAAFVDGADVISRATAADVGPMSFYDAKHGCIFECMVSLVARGIQVDFGTVAEELKAREKFEVIGGFPFLTQVSSRVPTTAQSEYYIDRVSSLSKQRRLIAATRSAHEAAQQGTPDWGSLWETVEPHLRAAQEAGEGGRKRSMADIAAQAIAWRMAPDSRPITATSWQGWDRIASPPRGGELIVIAGRPSTGKSTLAGNIADDVARRGQVAAFFSLEMSAEELVDRFAVRRAGREGIGNDKYANAAVAESIKAIGQMKTLRIYEAEDAPSVSRIEATCRLLAAAPQGLAAVIVDYLQLVAPPNEARREQREQQVAAMSRRFKLLARTIACPVFLLAQLNRESEKEDRRPRLSDLRESGSIEQDADRVWFLYRPKTPADMLQAEDASEIDVVLYQAKCRNGPAGIDAVLRFYRPTFDFRSR